MSKTKPTGPYAKLRPVMVEWIDSMATSGWGNREKPSDMRCVSIGHLVKVTKDRVHIARDRSFDCDGAHMEIPRAAVKRIRRLK